MRPLDAAIIVAYIAFVTFLGSRLGSRAKGLSGYFLGESNIPAWAVMISIVATETSTATFLSVPGISFREGGDFRFLELAFGYLLGRALVALVLLPAYFKGKIFTAYEVLNERFGGSIKTLASILFLAARLLADGLRLFLAANVLERIAGIDIRLAIVVMGVSTIVYTYLGGMRAVVWTDVIQFFIYIAGALFALKTLIGLLPGGWDHLVDAGMKANKFRLFDFRFDLAEPYNFWSGLFGGMFLTLATHGADQLMVQRYLSARSLKEASWSLITSGFVVIAQFALFLLIGVALYVFYHDYPNDPVSGLPLAIAKDREFATFIASRLPSGMLGIVVAAIFSAAMGSLSGSLNAAASSTVNDLYKPWNPQASEQSLVRLSKVMTAVWGALKMGVAMLAGRLRDNVVSNALSVQTFVMGILLGLFLMGVLTRSIGKRSALVGMTLGLATLLVVRVFTTTAWPWWALIGSATVFTAGALAHACGLDGRSTAPNPGEASHDA